MNLSSLRRRIRRLEQRQNARACARRIVFGRFSLYRDRLPEGTPVPEGARVVLDFHQQTPSGGPGFTGGYHRERITSDPGHNGVTVDESDREG